MAAQDNLSPEQFDALYHGTAARLNPGDLITPGRGSNHVARTADLKGKYVYATPERKLAYHHAANATQRVQRNYDSDHSDLVLGETKRAYKAGKVYRPAAPRIYEVEPTGRMTADPEANDDDFMDDGPSSVRSTKPFKVVRRVK